MAKPRRTIIFKFGPDGVVRWFWECSECGYWQMVRKPCRCGDFS